MASSFKKKSGTSSSRSQAAPRGSKVSLHNNQLLVSSGVPSLDNILGKLYLFLPLDSRISGIIDSHVSFRCFVLKSYCFNL